MFMRKLTEHFDKLTTNQKLVVIGLTFTAIQTLLALLAIILSLFV